MQVAKLVTTKNLLRSGAHFSSATFMLTVGTQYPTTQYLSMLSRPKGCVLACVSYQCSNMLSMHVLWPPYAFWAMPALDFIIP